MAHALVTEVSLGDRSQDEATRPLDEQTIPTIKKPSSAPPDAPPITSSTVFEIVRQA